MPALHPLDLSVWPAWLCRGRKPAEQVALAYLAERTLAGKPWGFTDLGRDCGMSGRAVHAVLDSLAADGILRKQEAPEDHARPAYEIVCDFLPDRSPAPAPASPARRAKPGHAPAPWVWRASRLWAEYRHGVLGPQEVERAMALAVDVQGEGVVLDAWLRYCRDGDKVFDTVRRFSENLGKWARSPQTEPAKPAGASFADLLREKNGEATR